MNTYSKGQHAELSVIKKLEEGGFKIIGHNIHGKHGEIDIAATKGRVLCLYEVKSLRVSGETHLDPLFAITPQKIARIQSVYYEKLHMKYKSYGVKMFAVRVYIKKMGPEITFLEIL